MLYIYILLLEQKKYYVGKTSNPEFRISRHFALDGSAWTKIHRPVKILEVIPDCDAFDEDKYTKICMSKYGIDNVRGGSFCQLKFDDSTRQLLERMLHSATDKCYTCGETDHFVTNCDSENLDVYNQKYSNRSQVDGLDFAKLQKLIFAELVDKKSLLPGESYVSNIFEHQDVGCRGGREWHLRCYTLAYLTDYGNIVICKSHFGQYPELKTASIRQEILSYDKLPDLHIRRLMLENWNDVTHPSKLKTKLFSILQECKIWDKLLNQI